MKKNKLNNKWLYLSLLSILVACNNYKEKEQRLIKQDTTAFGDPKTVKLYDSTENAYQACTIRDMKWTQGDIESVLLDPGAGWCFPGNILDVESFQNGEYKNITGNRNPITLIINSPAFNKPIYLVKDPSAATITEAIQKMLTAGTTGNVAGDVVVDAQEVYSKDHLKLLMKAQYSGGFGSVEAGFNFSNTRVISRYLLDVAQVYYTIFIEKPAEGFFSRRPKSLEAGTLSPVYISQIKYGRRVMIAVETEDNDQQKDAYLRAKVNAMATSGKFDSSILSNQFFSNKSVKILVKGGDARSAYRIFKAVSKKEEIYDVLAKDAHWSMKSLGVPLAFEAKNVADASTYYIAQTGTYKARICEIKTENDTVATPVSLHRLCYGHVGGPNRNFGNNPFTSFQILIKVDDTRRNIINAEISSMVEENGGDGTAGSYLKKIPVITLPETYTVTDIISSTKIIQPRILLEHKGPTPFKYDDSEQYPVSLVSIIGDSDGNNDDDLFPGACNDDIHAQIRTIDFHPIKFRFTKKVKK
jgi:hypothetical protein